MGLLTDIDKKLHRDLLDFIEKCERDENSHPLKFYLLIDLLKDILNGDREIIAMATNQKNGDVFVQFRLCAELYAKYASEKENIKN